MKKILVIEDNRDILENLTEFLELSHYEIIPANSGKKGVELIKENKPDLILCDIAMAEMDGYEVLQLVSDIIKEHKIPFIFCTARSEKTDHKKGMDLGAHDYIVKPFDMETLLTKVKFWINQKHIVSTK